MTQSPLTLLRVIPDLQVGGVQRMLLRTLLELKKLGVQPHVACLQERGALAQEFENNGIGVHLTPFASRLDPRGMWRLRRLITGLGAHVVHGHMYAANMAATLATMGLGRVVTINSYHSQTPLSGASQRRMVRWTRWRPDAWIAVSQAVRDPLVEAGVPARRIEVIYNGTATPQAAAPFEVRDPLAPLELVWAGRFVKNKRHELFVQIMELCRQQGLAVRLTLLGGGPTFERIRQSVQAAGLDEMVAMPGVVDDVSRRVAQADLYISVSRREGFPNALLEACAVGRGFLVSDIGPHRELLGESGAGLCLPDSPQAWTQAIADVLANRQRVAVMGERAFGIAQRYTLENAAAQTLALYRRLLAAKGVEL